MGRTRRNHKRTQTNVDAADPNRLEALVNFVKNAEPNTLDLANRQLRKADLQCVLNLLSEVQVTELNLKSNCLKNEMTDLAPLLTKTKIRKLDVSYCEFTKGDLLQLMEVLKDTQITDLIVRGYGWADGHKFNSNEAQIFMSYLHNSRLHTLIFDFLFRIFPQNDIISFAVAYLHTSINCIDLTGFTSNNLNLLFPNLTQSSVTELSLTCTYNLPEVLQTLSQNLVQTKVEKLNLSGNSLNDAALNILVDGLVGSKVTDLNLEDNHFSTLSPLFTKMKETHVRTLNLGGNCHLTNETFVCPDAFRDSCLTKLNLSHCSLSDLQGEGLIRSLRLSNVTELDISHNHFGLLTVEELAGNVSQMQLIDLDISHNNVPIAGFALLGACLLRSKLTRVNVSNIKGDNGRSMVASENLLSFLILTQGSRVRKVEMNNYLNAWNHVPVRECQQMPNTTFKELSFTDSKLRHSFPEVLDPLRSTALTHLNLSNNEILDNGAETIAECLPNTQIRRLNLSTNTITSLGAKALAHSLKDSNLLYLHLNANQIEDDGLESLATHAKGTAITVLDVLHNPGKKTSLVDAVLWHNNITVHKLVSVFRQIMPLTSDEFCFQPNSDSLDVWAFLEKCMWLYKTTIDEPRAINVLVDEKRDLCSKEQLYKLVREKFPRQFSDFIACGLEAGLSDYLGILQKAEDMGLTAVVESLLLHRPIYVLDKEQDILHPFVYTLLLKYKQPICNLAVEPLGVVKIIKYFDEHTDIEGAQDLKTLLCGASTTS